MASGNEAKEPVFILGLKSESDARHISEAIIHRDQARLAQDTWDESNMTLMRLRRLSRTVMCKSERHRFEARKLQRSNVVKFLEDHLNHHSEKVRYLALELLCCTIPRLMNKTDSLLRPLLPKVFQMLRNNEEKAMKLKALHFLRGFFRYSKNQLGYVEDFIKFGINNPYPDVQISCCIGLNIIFDYDIGNNLYASLVVSISNVLKQRNNLELTRAAYRSLKHIHKTLQDQRFYNLLKMANPESKDLYKSLYNFEETDYFLTSNETDCSAVIREYQAKRNYLGLGKDFGILHPDFLQQIRQTEECERVNALIVLARMLKSSSWTEKELDPYILDFLKVIKSFVSDSHRLVQIMGLVILKVIICKMGFSLSPHIKWISDILQPALTSPNTKIVAKTERVLLKLMRNIHPMTVIWNLFSTRDLITKEAVLVFLQNTLNHFSYHEIDMVALCDFLCQDLENANGKIAKNSKDCMILLLDMMHKCPTYGIRTEVVKILLRNHNLKTDTLREIGIIADTLENEYIESFESYSETTSLDTTCSIPLGSTATAFTETVSCHNTSIAAAESDITCTDVRSDLNVCNAMYRNESKCYLANEKERENLGKSKEENNMIILNRPQREFQVIKTWEEKSVASPDRHNESFSESSDTSTIKERLSSSGTDSSRSTYLSVFGPSNGAESFQQQTDTIISHGDSKRSYEYPEKAGLNQRLDSHSECRNYSSEKHLSSKEEDYVKDYEDGPFSTANNIIQSENMDVLQKLNAEFKPRKSFTCFTVKSEVKSSVSSSRQQIIGESVMPNGSPLQKSLEIFEQDTDSNVFESPKPKQNVTQKDLLNENVLNFVVSQKNDDEIREDINNCALENKAECETPETNNNLGEEEENLTDIKKLKTFKTTKPARKISRKISERSDTTFPVETDETSSEFSVFLPKTKKCSEYNESYFYDNKETDLEFANHSIVDVKSCITSPGVENNIEFANDSAVDVKSCIASPVVGKILEFANDSMVDVKSCAASPGVGKNIGRNQTKGSGMILCGEPVNKCTDNEETNPPLGINSVDMLEVLTEKSYPKDFEDIDTPFQPKSRQLTRTPVKAKRGRSTEVQTNVSKKNKKYVSNKKKVEIKKIKTDPILNNRCEESERTDESTRDKSPTPNDAGKKGNVVMLHNSPKWKGCQWRRDLEYAAKAVPCAWANIFEQTIQSMKPFPSSVCAEMEMKKVIDDLLGNSWKKKEEAMLTSIRLAKHHPKLIQDNASKIIVSVNNEIKNLRQSVAGKAILTVGYLYEIMGKSFESKLRLVVAALLAKSGNRTLAAYFRLVIRSLFKIMDSTSPQKLASAFIYEGSKHPNKAAKETAAQFLVVLTEQLGPENCIASTLASQWIKCAAMFVFDSSALTRYCGKRMFQVFINHRDFEKLKDHHLDINTIQNLSNVLEQIKSKGVTDEVLPINIID